MKVAGRKIPKGTLLLFLSFASISVCLLLVMSASRIGRINALSKNGLYSNHQRSFGVSNANGKVGWEDIIPELDGKYRDFAIFVPVSDPKVLMKGVCVHGKVESPPMLWGRYFDYQASWTERPTAVLGKDYQEDAVWRDGKRYYTHQDVEYEVIGIMGVEEESRLDQMVAIDFQSAIRLTGINTSYVLDARKEADILGIGRDMQRMFATFADFGMFLGERETGSLLDGFFSSDMIMDTIYMMTLASFFLSTILVTLIWLRFRRPLFFAWKLCGYGKALEWVEIIKRFSLSAISGFAAGFLAVFLVSCAMPDFSIVFMDVITACGVVIGLGAVILLVCAVLQEVRAKR